MSVIVVYGGGFQPFHTGHMSSYVQSKHAFPGSDFFVVASNDTKVRPIPFEDKKFLAQQAGVKDPFVQVAAPINPKEILSQYNPEQDIFILVRSERDPVNYNKKDGTPGYFQPFVSVDKCEPFAKHGYVFVSKKHTFDIGGVEIYSGSQVRSLYARANEAGKIELIKGLYPKSRAHQRIKQVFDKYLSGNDAPLAEGIFDVFKKKKEPTRDPINSDERSLISKYFPQNNAKIVWDNGEPVLPENVKAHYGKGILSFYKRDGQLKVSVAWHRSEEDRINPKATPLTHFDAQINSEQDLSNLKKKMSGEKVNEEAMTVDTVREGSKVETSRGPGIVRMIFSDGTASVRLQNGERARFKVSQLEAYHPEFAESIATKTKSAPIKPFSQVVQHPLDSLLTGAGDGAALKADPSYKRDIRRNNQIADQRKVIAAKVKAGYKSNNEEDWDTVNEDVKRRLATAALAAGLALNPASGVVLNPARVIGAQGQTVADPYKKVKPPTRAVDDVVDTEQKKKHHKGK